MRSMELFRHPYLLSLTPTAQQQLVFLEGRKKQLMQAALQAKQKNDIEGAKLFLRQAKGLDPMIEAAQNGLPVDITKVRRGAAFHATSLHSLS